MSKFASNDKCSSSRISQSGRLEYIFQTFSYIYWLKNLDISGMHQSELFKGAAISANYSNKTSFFAAF